ncbi:MAG: tetratricopeptide repeat protein [Burkholderiales bacterium]
MNDREAAAAIAGALDQAAALAAAGRIPEALRGLTRLVAEAPHCVEAWNRLAVLLAGRGEDLKALACLERALAIAPREPSLHANLGEIKRRAGLPEDALPHCERAVAIDAGHVAANLNLGYVLMDLGRIDAARPHFERVLAREPGSPFAWTGLGRALLAQGEADAAVAAFERTVAIAPADALAHALLARARLRRDDFAAALVAAQRSHTLAPGMLDADCVLADVHTQRGSALDAERVLRPALARHSGHAALAYRLALSRLSQGDYREGFRLYESRVDLEVDNRIALPILPMPLWQGEDLRGKRLLVLTEQGFGDHLQFCRFVARLAKTGVNVELGCSPELEELMASLPGCTAVHTMKAQARASSCDAWTFVGSLPHRLGVDATSVAPDGPYLFADPGRRARWRERLAALPPGRRVGLVWGGRPGHENDWRRSVPYAEFAPLAQVPGVTWINLQHGQRAADVHTQPQVLAMGLPDSDCATFADVAALIAEIDLVITIDSAPAHLAGALGKPVWVMIPHVADWRWELARDTSPWYPSMRLYRQSRQGDWSGVIAGILEELRKAC